MPCFSASSIIAMPMRSLTLPSGLKNSHLSAIVALRPCGDLVESDQRRATDCFDDVVVNPAHDIVLEVGVAKATQAGVAGKGLFASRSGFRQAASEPRRSGGNQPSP